MFELITTICNVATLGVLLTAATAAIVQLRHVRAGNQLQAVLAIERGFADPELRRALLYVQNELPRQLELPAYRAELITRGYIDSRKHPEMAVCNWLNDLGAMVAGKFVSEDIFFESFGRLVEYYWRLLDPVIALLRRERGSEQYANFEFLAYRAQRWSQMHAAGTYPPAVPRMPIADPWLDADASSQSRTVWHSNS